MSLGDIMDIASTGMTANRFWLERIANNMANVTSTRTTDGAGAYRREVPVFSEILSKEFGGADTPGGVQATGVVKDRTPLPRVYNPGHRDADATGFVQMPNVNIVYEMVDMIAASRTYEANITVSSAAKNMMTKALDIGK